MNQYIIYQIVSYRKKVVKIVITNITSKLRGLIYYISEYYLLKYYRKYRNSGKYRGYNKKIKNLTGCEVEYQSGGNDNNRHKARNITIGDN